MAYPQTPFSRVEIEKEPIRIDPNGFAAVKLKILTNDNATSGTFALPCQIIYRDGSQRREDLAVLVFVQNAWFLAGFCLWGVCCCSWPRDSLGPDT